MRLAQIALVLLCVNVAGAQPRLVKDINQQQTAVGSAPHGLAVLGDVTLFAANDSQHANELWRTDGTKEGTFLVRDIDPGPRNGLLPSFFSMPVINGRMLFSAHTSQSGHELWSSDGTRTGTVLLADIMPFELSSSPALMGQLGSTYYFAADSPVHGRELWQTDGTPEGTRVAVDLNPSSGSSSPRYLGHLGSSRMLIEAFDGTNTGIFTTDGTAAGTHFVAALDAHTSVSFGSTVLFIVQNGPNAWTLMRTDGTTAGTSAVKSGFVNAPPILFRPAGNGIRYFSASDGISGEELWITDGTTAGTQLLADLTPGPASTGFDSFFGVGDRAVFSTRDRLWASDGTAAGTILIKELGSSAIRAATASGGTYYFGWKGDLWKTDGTIAGTTLVVELAGTGVIGIPGQDVVAPMLPLPAGVFFTADDGLTGWEPWISDGTAAGTRGFNVAPDTAVGSSPSNFANVDGKLWFTATEGGPIETIWSSDGTEPGTTRLVTPGSPLFPRGAVASGGLYYFRVAGDMPELWRSDGTVAGTFRLFQSHHGRAITMLPFKGGLFFTGSDGEHGVEPWFTDGTIAGTRLIADLGPEDSIVFDDDAIVAGDYVYFGAGALVDEIQAWRTDGATAQKLISQPETLARRFTQVGDSVFFATNAQVPASPAFDLWRSSIPSGQTVLVRHFEGHPAPPALWNVGGQVMFISGDELWRSDGTGAGTMKVADVIPSCFNRANFVVGDGVLYWYTFTAFAFPELWRSDGTAAGTFRLRAFNHSSRPCDVHPLHYSGGRLYLSGVDDFHGQELWVSDGTIAGTRMLYDVNPGAASSSPGNFLTIGSTLYFSAVERNTGRELWAYTIGCNGRECQPRRRAARH